MSYFSVVRFGAFIPQNSETAFEISSESVPIGSDVEHTFGFVDAEGGVIHGEGGDAPRRINGDAVSEFEIEGFSEDGSTSKRSQWNK